LDYLLARSEHPCFSEYPLCPTISGHSTTDKVSAESLSVLEGPLLARSGL
jgi:hypothetical protein